MAVVCVHACGPWLKLHWQATPQISLRLRVCLSRVRLPPEVPALSSDSQIMVAQSGSFYMKARQPESLRAALSALRHWHSAPGARERRRAATGTGHLMLSLSLCLTSGAQSLLLLLLCPCLLQSLPCLRPLHCLQSACRYCPWPWQPAPLAPPAWSAAARPPGQQHSCGQCSCQRRCGCAQSCQRAQCAQCGAHSPPHWWQSQSSPHQ